MERATKSLLILLVSVVMAFGILGATLASQVSEGQVVVVQEQTLFIRTQSNEPLSFNPYFVQENGRWVPSRPARTILPALESGETVRVTWTLDEREGRRRIDSIQVISPLEGTTKATVASASTSQLTIRPKDEPGNVALNPRWVQREGRWVPDPAIAAVLAGLKPGMKVTVRWGWDNEGRKRILALESGW